MSIKQPLVTIGIPTYNRANGRLGDALRCAMSQTYPNIEIIVADNCSSDNTQEFMAEFISDKVRYIRHETNIGPINNWNSCLENANGEYFLLFHDDDAIDSDFVECCIEAIKGQDNIGMIRTGIRIIDGDGNTKSEHFNRAGGLSSVEFIFAWFNEETSLYIPCTLFNTKKLKKMGGMVSPYDVFCDAFADIKLASKYDRIDVREIKASFRRHDQNYGSSSDILFSWCRDSLALLELICKLHPEDAPKLRKEGGRFLCLKCYHQVLKIDSSLWRKTINYLKVRKMFGGACPLWPFYRKHEIRRVFGPLKRKLLGD